MFLEILQNSQENQNLFSNKVALEQVFSCQFCGISKNTFLKEHLRATASVIISESKVWKALLYYSNFVKRITECNQKCWTFPFRSSFVLRQNRLFCYKTLYICTELFAHTFFQLTRTPDLLWKESRISISCVIFVISMILMNVFVCPYSFVNITGNSCSFLLFHFCFKFYYPLANIIVNHRYLVFFRSRKTNTNCCDKNKKNIVTCACS